MARLVIPASVDARARVAAGYAAVIGSLMFMISPVLLGAMSRTGAYTAAELGLLGSAPMFGMFAGALAAGACVAQLARRRTVVALVLVMSVAYLLLAQAHEQLALAGVLLFVSGVAGAGLLAVGFAELSKAPLPDRAFAIWIAFQLATGAALVWILGAVGDAYGLGALVALLGALTLSPLALASWLPGSGGVPLRLEAQASSPAQAAPTTPAGQSTPAVWSLALLAVVLFGAGVMLVWPFMEELGRDRFGTASPARETVSLSLAVSIVAALCAGALAGRVRRWIPMSLATALIVSGAWLVAAAPSTLGFVAGGVALAFGWNLIPAFQLGLLTDIDRSGRLVVLNIALLKLGYALGPLLGGLLSSPGWFAVASAALVGPSLLLFLWLDPRRSEAAMAR
jgi:predicted MFS family arabinose efflux permease